MKSYLLPIAFAAMLVSVAAQRSHAELVVTNGNFQDLTGLTGPQFGVWYAGLPTGWTGVNTNFTVRELDPAPSGNYAANLNALTTASPFVALSQAIGTLPSTSIISLTFELIPLISPTSMSAGIFNTNNSANYGDWTPLALPASAFSTAGFHTLATSVPISANTPIGIAFWQGGSTGAPAIDNVSVVPEPSSAMLLLASIAGVGGFAAVRRRR